MRVGRIAAGATLLLALGFEARADFEVTYTSQPGIGALVGNTIFKFYAHNDGRNGQVGTYSLFGFEFFMDSLGAPLKFKYLDRNGDGELDADLYGETQTVTSPTGSHFRLGTNRFISWIDYKYDMDLCDSRYAVVPPAEYFANRTSIVGTAINLDKIDASGTPGPCFAVAIVPTGTNVHLHGQMAAEKGSVYGSGAGMTDEEYVTYLLARKDAGGGTEGISDPSWYSFSIMTPEPGSLLALSGILMVLGRRRRAK